MIEDNTKEVAKHLSDGLSGPAVLDRWLGPSPRAALLLLMFFALGASAEELSVSVDCFEADINIPMNYFVELRVESDDEGGIVTITSYSELAHLIRTFACGESGNWLLTITKPTGELEYVVRFKPMESEE